MRIPVIIDTDMASDDWMAILYLLESPNADVKAITVTATGEAHARPGTLNALRLLELTGKREAVVACGRETPLRGSHCWPLIVRVVMDARLGLRLPRTRLRPAARTAVATLIDLLRGSSEPLTILALGPLTNIAEAILEAPDIAGRIASIVLMGGAVDVPGNIAVSGFRGIDNDVAEWNIYCDPYAAGVVFRSGVPLTLAPLDVTNTVPLTRDFLERARAYRATPAADFVVRLLGRLSPLINRHDYYFWDPLAAVLVTHPGIGSYTERMLRVVEEEGPQSGRTLAAEDGSPVRVCTAIDTARFEAILLNTLNRSEVPAP
ncbi:MAG: nucleoside hydrolase [Anaerolineae bacterium]|nr:nucleoside hydrolase [Anaerolineae bacterium]